MDKPEKNGGRTLIFSSVVSRLLESVTPYASIVLSEFEKKNQLSQLTKKEIDDKLEELFERFPRKIPLYSDIIHQLKLISSANIADTVHFLTKIIKEVLNGKISNQFIAINQVSPLFDPAIPHQFLLAYYYSLFFITDLLCQIVVSYDGPKHKKYLKDFNKASLFLVRTGYNISMADQKLPKTFNRILRQWSIIISIISENQFSQIYQMFQLISTSDDITSPLCLIRFIRLDVDATYCTGFYEQLFPIIRNHIKKKTITNSALDSISCMIVSMPYNEDLFTRLYNLVCSLKKDKILWKGTLLLMSSLVQFLPNTKYHFFNRQNKFLHNRILNHVHDKTKLPTLLRCFEAFIVGKNRDPPSEIWEWGKNPRSSKLAYIRLYSGDNPIFPVSNSSNSLNFLHSFGSSSSNNNSNNSNTSTSPETFITIFMNHFFLKSDFSVCPKLFKRTLLHLASIDFAAFMDNFVTKTLSLDFDDPRFITLLMLVPPLNSEDFILESYCYVAKPAILEFNNTIKPYILKALNKCRMGEFEYHGVCLGEYDILLDSLTIEADQKLSEILDEWRIHDFTERILKHNRSVQVKGNFSLLGRLIPTLKYILAGEDLTPNLIDSLIEFSCHQNNIVASQAYFICKEIVPRYSDVSDFLRILMISASSNGDAESIFIQLSLIHNLIANHYQNGGKLDTDLLYDLETICFLRLCSLYPSTRQLVFEILNLINTMLKNKGIIGFCFDRFRAIEKNVKSRMVLHTIKDSPDFFINPASFVPLDTAILSHYYDVWLFFIAEIVNNLIAVNYTPFFQRMNNIFESLINLIKDNENPNRSLSDAGMLILILNTLFYKPALVESEKVDFRNQYEPYGEKPDDRHKVCETIHEFIHSGNERLIHVTFTMLPHLHFTLLTPIIDVLSEVPREYLPESTFVLSVILRLPDLERYFFYKNLQRITNFMSYFSYIIQNDQVFSTRLVSWDDKSLCSLKSSLSLLRNYCIIIITTFREYPDEIHENEWPINTREVVFRYLLNWALTTDESLRSLRVYAKLAIATLAKVGPIFSGAFDDATAELFGKMEEKGVFILDNLLKYRYDVLIDDFIKACYVQPGKIADLYFDAIADSMSYDRSNMIMSTCGPIIFLSHVYYQKEHPKANDLISSFISICDYIDNTDEIRSKSQDHTNLPKILSFAVEDVFMAFFDTIKLSQSKKIYVPFKCIVEAIRPWISVVRLLPKQSACSRFVVKRYHNYTPYQFLVTLLKFTDPKNDEQFRMMASLWIDLIRSPDHSDIVPQYLSSQIHQTSNIKIFIKLIEAFPRRCMNHIIPRCSFAYYYHVTKCQKKKFEPVEKWLSSLLLKAIQRSWEKVEACIPYIIHFIFVFRKSSTLSLFSLVCKKMNVEFSEGIMLSGSIHSFIDQFISKMSESDVEEWGNEALKWFFGCNDVDIALTSLCVYNRIMKPFDPSIIKSVIKIIAYYVDQEYEDSKSISLLVQESFIFFNHHVNTDLDLAFKYTLAFMDCREFIEEGGLKDSMKIFLQAMKIPDHMIKIQRNIISVIRPTIPILEVSQPAQKIITKAYLRTKNEEVLMIVAPIKKAFPHFFDAIPPCSQFIKGISDNALSAALVHYSMMESTATRSVLNAIFEISTYIVNKIQLNENNRSSLARIYQSALRSMNRCSYAIEFVRSICEKDPLVATVNLCDIYEWDRPAHTVSRSLKLLIMNEEFSPVTISDFRSYTSTQNLIDIENAPKVLPFSTQAEILEGMRNIPPIKEKHKNKKIYVPKTLSEDVLPSSVSIIFVESSKPDISLLRPLQHPRNLILDQLLSSDFTSTSIPIDHEFTFPDIPGKAAA
ncbi:hypothetical protein TRFO_27418 [Tritrichomonas foetus]|uniref:Uncharacterized protein n=1 Tax=Tritrichomonas foetus TaxID=1144522 RepID=A0A1J4K676_9EUKA|nr:hypothetical protein TRFO_27418 [Tritrichomonas foetus]|eukprot:OHT04973.1 hypothetical protein TRFO_27418 [Tritrichomonas foetus]